MTPRVPAALRLRHQRQKQARQRRRVERQDLLPKPSTLKPAFFTEEPDNAEDASVQVVAAIARHSVRVHRDTWSLMYTFWYIRQHRLYETLGYASIGAMADNLERCIWKHSMVYNYLRIFELFVIDAGAERRPLLWKALMQVDNFVNLLLIANDYHGQKRNKFGIITRDEKGLLAWVNQAGSLSTSDFAVYYYDLFRTAYAEQFGKEAAAPVGDVPDVDGMNASPRFRVQREMVASEAFHMPIGELLKEQGEFPGIFPNHVISITIVTID